jgi:hypothetical protein
MRFTGMGRDRKYEIPACGRQAKYEIRNTELKPISNVQRRLKNVEWRYLVLSTSYVFYRLDTSYSILDTFSNVER